MAFLDAKHGEDWAIWEFRAEGTGYPDAAVHGRIRHYPWPDHHPPPFRLVPLIMKSMKNWLGGGDLGGGPAEAPGKHERTGENNETKRVVVVHCKAGKGRSGTMASSYLIAERGWTPEDALARFTERRMRPNFGAGVSIPSQLRWVGYVDRWTKGGKQFVDREVEIVELHVWGLRHGVKVSVEGYVDDGRKIHVFHTFKADERFIVEGDAPGGAGIRDFVSDVAEGLLSPTIDDEIVEEPEQAATAGGDGESKAADSGISDGDSASSASRQSKKPKSSKTATILRSLSRRTPRHTAGPNSAASRGQTGQEPRVSSQPALPSALGSSAHADKRPSEASPPKSTSFAAQDEPGGQAVIFKPAQPIRIANGDVNVALERRNRAPASMGLTMVTAVAHVWFNTFFEGNGPEQGGTADDAGVFEIDWDRMDGIKGSSQKGTRAADRIAVVWRVPSATKEGDAGAGAPPKPGDATANAGKAGGQVLDVSSGEVVPQMEAADWRGGNEEDPDGQKHLGLRAADPESEAVSRASSVLSLEFETANGKTATDGVHRDSMAGVKTSGPEGDALEVVPDPSGGSKKGGSSTSGL